MGIDALSGASSNEPIKGVQGQPQEPVKVTLGNIFDKDSDGGEEITQSEYEQLSKEDKVTVNGWRALVAKHLGKDAALTFTNIRDAEIEEKIGNIFDQEVENKKRKAEAMEIVHNVAIENEMSESDVIDKLAYKGIDIEVCSLADLVEALKNIKLYNINWGL